MLRIVGRGFLALPVRNKEEDFRRHSSRLSIVDDEAVYAHQRRVKLKVERGHARESFRPIGSDSRFPFGNS